MDLVDAVVRGVAGVAIEAIIKRGLQNAAPQTPPVTPRSTAHEHVRGPSYFDTEEDSDARRNHQSDAAEYAAKTVVGRCAKNSGRRSSEAGLRGTLTLRALHQSNRLPHFWSYLSRRYVADIAQAA